MLAPERLVLLVLVHVCSACTMVGTQSPPPAVEEDAAAVRAQMSVKTALVSEPKVAAAPIRVQFEKGSVVLTGFVESEAEKDKAGEIARQAVPDLEIINDLQVRGVSVAARQP